MSQFVVQCRHRLPARRVQSRHGTRRRSTNVNPHPKDPTMKKTLPLLAVVAALIGVAALPPAAQAGERHTTVTGANGKSATRNVQRAAGDVQSSTTGPNGKTISRAVDRSASGATATVTGPNGKTATRTTTVQK
jgi:hypothetical protein